MYADTNKTRSRISMTLCISTEKGCTRLPSFFRAEKLSGTARQKPDCIWYHFLGKTNTDTKLLRLRKNGHMYLCEFQSFLSFKIPFILTFLGQK